MHAATSRCGFYFVASPLPEPMRAVRPLGIVRASITLATLLCALAVAVDAAQPEVLIVVGAEGEPEYGEQFRSSVEMWREATEVVGVEMTVIGLDESTEGLPSDHDRLRQFLADGRQSAEEHSEPVPLWLILVGHGTYDGRTARFNLRGPDVAAAELASWLADYPRPLALLDCSSSSAPFLPALSGADRVVLTATRSGDELQYARMGQMLAESVGDPAADLDKDQQVSLLEAIVFASRKVARFYQEQGRLATEHALLDDNGDQRGTPVQWFEGVMAIAKTTTEHALDGGLTHQWQLAPSVLDEQLGSDGVARRAELEQQLYSLRRRKSDFVDEDRYYQQLEEVLVQLAGLYHSAEVAQK